jgi:ubiquinone/menaquinone biosynthesis C-methylase UbiE
MRNPLFAVCYDRALRPAEDRGLADVREHLLAGCHGTVLEVGAGTGLNLPHYPVGVERLVLSDPWPAMLRRLTPKLGTVRSGVAVDVVVADGTALPFPDATFDEVVTTLVMCSVPRPAVAAELHRVLRPGGRWRFLEHVAAGPDGPARLQRVLQPFQRALADGCRFDLRMPPVLAAAGFTVTRSDAFALPGAMPWLAPAVHGEAVA